MPKGVNVKTSTIKSDKIEYSTEYVSKFTTRKSTAINPRIEGPIENIYVLDGDYVDKGQILMSIESSAQAATSASATQEISSALSQYRQAQATLEAYKADRDAAISQLELSKIDYERYKDLYEKGSATKADYDKYTNAYNQAKAQLKSTEEQIKAQKLLVDAQESVYKSTADTAKTQDIQLSYFQVKAPFAGKIGDIPVKVGQYVSPQTVLTTITQNNPLEVEIWVDISKKDKLKEGMKVRINTDTDKTRMAELYFISPVINETSQTILTKAFVDNSDNTLRVDEVVNASIIWDIESGLKVPTSAVAHYAGQDFVYVLSKTDKGTFSKQIPVNLGKIIDNEYVVESGLKSGQEIIVTGIQKLRDQTPVVVDDQK
jgi:multidrug efflux pump subunit AcrA (membrane-fusion protein)